MVLSLDTLQAHLPFHSSHTLLLHTTLPFSANSVPTLVDSGTTNNFIDEPLVTTPDHSTTTPDSAATTPTPTPIDLEAFDIKIISVIPFACILQDGTPAFQLQIMPALLEEYLCTETTPLEQKTEEQILHKEVPLEYHEFADIFFEGSIKELPLHCSYNCKIDLKKGISSPFGKIYNMSEIKLQALKDYLNNILGKGFIHSSISAASAPVLFAKKKDKSL
ncbi:hypothetical protein E4T56_gene1622 [Termitomyces sp. T112]|nr:hypothetical protein E4T56_gene1622 [Termitomyces sp. T112]